MNLTTPLIVALLLFTIAQLGTVAGAVLLFRSDNQSLRREIELLRQQVHDSRTTDKQFMQLQLDNMSAGVRRIERHVSDLLRAMNLTQRASDPSPLKE